MSWINREIQNKVLALLFPLYPDSINIMQIHSTIFPEDKFPLKMDIPEQAKGLEVALGLSSAVVRRQSAIQHSVNYQLLFKTIHYLVESGLIDITKADKLHGTFECRINNKGIDFMSDDGGLSAILGVVTVKLHSDTIQALLSAKIDEANISPEEKGRLKSALGKVGNAALGTLTENAINAFSVESIVTWLKRASSL